jgi:hypothetical protein
MKRLLSRYYWDSKKAIIDDNNKELFRPPRHIVLEHEKFKEIVLSIEKNYSERRVGELSNKRGPKSLYYLAHGGLIGICLDESYILIYNETEESLEFMKKEISIIENRE